jgi:hypothetical protein
MKCNFVKWNLYIFEIISFLMTIWTTCCVFYYTIFFRHNEGLKLNNLIPLIVNFTAVKNYEISTDMNIKIDSFQKVNGTESNYDIINNVTSGYILINKFYIDVAKLSNEKVLKKINKLDLSNIFIFKDYFTAKKEIERLYDFSYYTLNFWNLITLISIVFFFLFMKFNLSKLTLQKIKKIKEPSDVSKNFPSVGISKHFFGYIIFHLSVIFILPVLYMDCYEYHIKQFIGFRNNYFNAFFFDRTFLYEIENTNVNVLTSYYNNEDPHKDKFFLRSPNIYKESSITLNRDMVNMLFLCVLIWISGKFDIFTTEDPNSSNSVSDENIKINIFKKIGIFFFNILLYLMWFLFFVYGSLDLYDNFLFNHDLVFFSPRKLLDIKVLVFIFVVYYHFYFYFILIYYSIQTKQQEKLNRFISKVNKRDTPLISNEVFVIN